MAEAAGCSTRSIKAIRSNLHFFGITKAPSNGVGRPRPIIFPMLDALREYLLEKPEQYLDEMAVFLWDEFDVLVTTATISRTLVSIGWSKKTIRRRAREQNPDLRDFYLYNLSAFRSYHLVYVDELGCDKRIGFRRTGWSPLGATSAQIALLPAYTQDGILLTRLFQGSTDSIVFEDFIEQLLSHCGRWP
jgi:transposase